MAEFLFTEKIVYNVYNEKTWRQVAKFVNEYAIQA